MSEGNSALYVSIYTRTLKLKLMSSRGRSELLLLLGCGGFFCLALLWWDSDILVGWPVVKHTVQVLRGVDFIPSHSLVTILAHLFKQLIELLTWVSMNIDGVDELTLIEEFEAGHAFGGHQDWCLCELGCITVQPATNLQMNGRIKVSKVIRVTMRVV